MARIRSVKPELRESKIVGSWPMEVRYFWVLFWGYLDDHGRGLDLPKRIAGDCFPLDSDDYGAKDVDTWLDLMTKGVDDKPGPVCRYEIGGTRYLHAVNWHEHQKPNRPSQSRIPPCPLHEGVSEGLSESRSEGAHGDSLPGAGEQGSRGAGEQQQRAHESRSEGANGARRIVIDATGATPEEADRLIARVKRERQPRALTPFLRRMATDGDLSEWLAELRAQADKPEVSAALRAIRDGPPCEHGRPGGALPHPTSGKPVCPLCRSATPLAS